MDKSLPRMTLIRQRFIREAVEFSIPAILQPYQESFAGLKSIAIAVGSRGIAGISDIVKDLASVLKGWGLEPFVVAAMGSHGNGTVQGQLEVLAGLGIHSDYLGIPVVASTDVIEIPGNRYPASVLVNDLAWKADGVIILNRIKKHTDIHSEYESGILKMIAIGLGNRQQAEVLHSKGLQYLTKSIPLIAQDVLDSGKICLGIGVIEDAFGEIFSIEAMSSCDILDRERRLLMKSKELSARLPVSDLDVLVIDQGGKNISGSCIETNVIGRMSLMGEDELDTPKIKRIVVSDLSDESHGNAAGIGLADFITRRFYNKIDFAPTYRNCISCIFPERGKLPIVMESDEQAILCALETSRAIDWAHPRVIRIADTNHLEYLYVSDSVLNELRGNPNIEVLASHLALVDSSGSLVPFFS